MHPTAIKTAAAPEAIGPYAQAVRANGFVFTSGQIPLDPLTGEMVKGDVKEQTRRVLENLKAVLSAAGTSIDRVVKASVFLADMGDFAAMNEIYAEYFQSTKPARSTIQAAKLPKDAKVEIDFIAAI